MPDNKAAVRRFWDEVICDGDMVAFDELVSPDFVDLHHRTGNDATALRNAIEQARSTMASQRFDEIQMAAEGDVVFALVDYSVTHEDGTTKTERGVLYYRFADGKIVENMMAAPA